MDSSTSFGMADLPPNMILGENQRPAFRNTDSACLDVFFSVVPGMDAENLRELLEKAWNENPELALRLIFNIGNVRGGKQDRANYYRALTWLYEEYPLTFFLNLREIPKHSCLKCLLNLLMFLTHPESEIYGLEGSIRSLSAREAYMASLGHTGHQRRAARRDRQLQLRREFAQSLGAYEIKLVNGLSLQGGRMTLEQLRIPKVRRPRGWDSDGDGNDIDDDGSARQTRYSASNPSKYYLLMDTDWVSPEIRAVWDAFARTRDEERADAARERRRSLQRARDEDVRARLQGLGSAVQNSACAPLTGGAANGVHDLDASKDSAEEGGPSPLTGRIGQPFGDSHAGAEITLSSLEVGKDGDSVRQSLSADGDLESGASADAQMPPSEGALDARKKRPDPRAGGEYLRRLYDEVADIFAKGIAEELALANRNVKSLSGLHAKWAPTPDGMHDKATRISEGIAARLHAAGLLGLELDPGLDPAVARSLQTDRMRKVVSRLRGVAKVPEHFVGTGAWEQVDYNRMASRCRLIFGEKVFRKHDAERYDAFLQSCLEAAESGESMPGLPSVKSGALLPHEVTARSANAGGEETKLLEADLQWKGLVDGCVAAGAGQALRMVPVCDVSGSMEGEPMEVAVALSLLLAESAPRDSPWHGRVMTFSGEPNLVEVPGIPVYGGGKAANESASVAAGDQDGGESGPDATSGASGGDGSAAKGGDGKMMHLAQRVDFVKGLDWGMNTDVEAVFDLLLSRLKSAGATPEEVQKLAVVIFSDMEFDDARGASLEPSNWGTAHESITAKFVAAGFAPRPPLLVYWNLRYSPSIPVSRQDEPGVILISGYSAGMVRSFLEGRLENMTPAGQMWSMLGRGVYRRLRVAEEDWPEGWDEARRRASREDLCAEDYLA